MACRNDRCRAEGVDRVSEMIMMVVVYLCGWVLGGTKGRNEHEGGKRE